ncbi:hypothetical protein BBP40_008765 [Aspergillus hancockii]|nr:hypothetical protein BBP40_008765 [Aspergillus hancockii]
MSNEIEILYTPKPEALIRFQRPRDGQSTVSARVTQTEWTTAQRDVDRSFRDFYNLDNTNVQLWLGCNQTALSYAGINCSNVLRAVYPQTGLHHDKTAVTFLLPSGMNKVTLLKVNTSTEFSDKDKEAAGLIYGINGTLEPSDLAYTDMKHLREQATSAYRKPENRIKIDAEDGNGKKLTISMQRV